MLIILKIIITLLLIIYISLNIIYFLNYKIITINLLKSFITFIFIYLVLNKTLYNKYLIS